jgi:hypothetical protein
MHIAVHHQITNPQKWEQATTRIKEMVTNDRLPKGLKGLLFLPAMDGHKADCVWEANSLESLKGFLDRETGSGAKNEYFQIDDATAFGLPSREEVHHHA